MERVFATKHTTYMQRLISRLTVKHGGTVVMQMSSLIVSSLWHSFQEHNTENMSNCHCPSLSIGPGKPGRPGRLGRRRRPELTKCRTKLYATC